jgi:hypothetical protein
MKLKKLINKIKDLFIEKEVKCKMNIEISDKTTTADLKKIIGWLQDQGYEPVIKGRGNGEVYIKAQVNETGQEEAEPASSNTQLNQQGGIQNGNTKGSSTEL